MVKDGEVAIFFQPLPDWIMPLLGRHLCEVADAVIEADDLSWNVVRAHTVGMRAAQFTSTAALREFLIQEGIEFPTVGAS